MNISSKLLLLTALTTVSVEANCAEASSNKNQNNPLKLQRIVDQSTQGKATSCLIFNDEMNALQNQNILKKYLTLKDSNGAVFSSFSPFISDRKLCLSGLNFGENYSLTIKKGIEGFISKTTDKDLSVKFKTADAQSSVSFTNGLILPINNSAAFHPA